MHSLSLSCLVSDCFLSAQQHHGPGAVLRYLLQVSFCFFDCYIYLFTASFMLSIRQLLQHLVGLLLRSGSAPRRSLLNWALTWSHKVTVGGSSLRKDTSPSAAVLPSAGEVWVAKKEHGCTIDWNAILSWRKPAGLIRWRVLLV